MDAAQRRRDQAHNCLSVCARAEGLMGNIRSVRTRVTHGRVWILIYERVILRINNIMSFQIKMSAGVIPTAGRRGSCSGPAGVSGAEL